MTRTIPLICATLALAGHFVFAARPDEKLSGKKHLSPRTTVQGADHVARLYKPAYSNEHHWTYPSTDDVAYALAATNAPKNDGVKAGRVVADAVRLPSVETRLQPGDRARRDQIRQTIDFYSRQMQNTVQHCPWEMMHAIIAYGVDTKVRVGGPYGEPVTAIGWLCYNQPANGLQLFYRTPQGIAARNGPGLQGHSGQFLAMMAQSKVKEDYPLKVGGADFTINDMIEYEKRTCQSGTELTFKLIGLVHYLGTDATWRSEDGQNWSIERLVREELAQPIRGATCGGTHRLMGFSYALHKRAREGKPTTGQFARARKYIDDYHKYTFQLQNADGSFSTAWFRGREDRPNIDRQMQTTGHILEWMVYSLPEDQLRDPRTVAAVDYLSGILYAGRGRHWEIGPLGHAVHALVLYNDRVYENADEATPSVASTNPDEAETPVSK